VGGDQEEAVAESQDELEAAVPEVRPGQIVKGTVVQAGKDGVLVDVGLKYEGIIPAYEFPSPADVPEVGAEVDVAVVRVDDDEGSVVLSKKQADYENVWRRILEAHKTGEVITAMVTERVKGGLRVDLGVQGFVPASQVGVRRLRDLDRMVGRSLRLRVTEVEKNQKKVILSHRQVIEEERRQRREETMARLVEGGVFKGRVRNLTDYGAFVDLGGVDGLLHISEMSWTRIKHPSEVLKMGDTIEVIVLKIDQERNRISLGRKQILPDPWKEAAKALEVGSVVSGRVTRVVPFGAFVQLECGIEGIVPNSEVSERRGVEAKDVVKVDDTINIKILNIRPEERRMTLSILQAQQEQDRREYQEYMRAHQAQRPTIGDLYGEALKQHRAALEAAEGESTEPQAAAPETEEAPADAEPAAGAEAEEPAEAEAESEDETAAAVEGSSEEDAQSAEQSEEAEEQESAAESVEEEPAEDEHAARDGEPKTSATE
jgi:4-hydroxy-3-methylbut-2-enyl diphosphate reductase